MKKNKFLPILASYTTMSFLSYVKIEKLIEYVVGNLPAFFASSFACLAASSRASDSADVRISPIIW